MTKQAKQEQAEVIRELKELLKPGDTVYTILNHVSRSGMSRSISAYIMQDNKPRKIDYQVSKAIKYPVDRSNGGVKITGCGMDMGFALIDSLSWALYPEYQCPGENCQASDHFNAPHPPKDKTMKHKGYAFKHQWM